MQIPVNNNHNLIVRPIQRLLLDSLDMIEHKVALILSGKQTKKKTRTKDKDSTKSGKAKERKKSKDSKKSSKSSRSSKPKRGKTKKSDDKSSKASKKAKIKNPEIFMKLSEEFFYEIVKLKLQTCTTLVIESLDSIFIRRPLLALNAILKGIGNVKYIHFFLLTYTFDQCKIYENNKQQFVLEDKLLKEKNKIQEITDMSQEEYLLLSDEDKKLYKETILNERKRKSLERREALKYTVCTVAFYYNTVKYVIGYVYGKKLCKRY